MDKVYFTDFNKYVSDLEDMLWDAPEIALAMGMGHTTIHMRGNEDTTSMITRMFEEGVKGAGSFLGSKEEAMDNIQQAAIFKVETIAKWVMSDRNAFSSKDSYNYLPISVDMAPAGAKDSVITGISLTYDEKTGDIVETKSHGVRLVLKRDKGCIMGFHLRTAYSDPKSAEPTGVRYTKDDILNGKFYEFPNRLSLASFANEDNNTLSFYGEDSDHQPYIRVVHKNSKYSAYIREVETKYYSESGGMKKRVGKDEILANAPDMECAVKEMEDIARTRSKLRIKGKEVQISDLVRHEFAEKLKKKVKNKYWSPKTVQRQKGIQFK